MNRNLFIAIRKLNGLTQVEHAIILGVSRSLVAKIEVGERSLCENIVDKVAAEFGTEHIKQISELI